MVIPARIGSQRLPGKVLADVAGRPLMCWTAEMASRSCVGADNVFIATGDESVAQAALHHHLKVLRTPVDLPSGTARVAWAARQLPEGVRHVINVQADEPLLDPGAINQLLVLLADGWDVVTTVCPIEVAEWRSSSVVKAVVDQRGEARWFTRAPIPHRLATQNDASVRKALAAMPEICRHLGVYGFERSVLARWTEASESAVAEAAGLEQLGALAAGWRMGAARVARPAGPAVDTHVDLQDVRVILGRPTGA